jgi:hypothetical protein
MPRPGPTPTSSRCAMMTPPASSRTRPGHRAGLPADAPHPRGTGAGRQRARTSRWTSSTSPTSQPAHARRWPRSTRDRFPAVQRPEFVASVSVGSGVGADKGPPCRVSCSTRSTWTDPARRCFGHFGGRRLFPRRQAAPARGFLDARPAPARGFPDARRSRSEQGRRNVP